jgi:hypothetical protein
LHLELRFRYGLWAVDRRLPLIDHSGSGRVSPPPLDAA